MVDMLGNISDLLAPAIARLSAEVKTPIHCHVDYDKVRIMLKHGDDDWFEFLNLYDISSLPRPQDDRVGANFRAGLAGRWNLIADAIRESRAHRP